MRSRKSRAAPSQSELNDLDDPFGPDPDQIPVCGDGLYWCAGRSAAWAYRNCNRIDWMLWGLALMEFERLGAVLSVVLDDLPDRFPEDKEKALYSAEQCRNTENPRDQAYWAWLASAWAAIAAGGSPYQFLADRADRLRAAVPLDEFESVCRRYLQRRRMGQCRTS